MPYIGISTSKKLLPEQKEALKIKLGEKISLIPGKSQSRLMVDISDGHDMFMSGEKRDLAYIDVKYYGSAELQHKEAFTKAVFEIVGQLMDLSAKDIYVTISEHAIWGLDGMLI